MDDGTAQLAAMIGRARCAVFFGGAGVSTESGLMDFRSPHGLYAAQKVFGHPPEELLSHHVFVADPGLFFRYYKQNLVAMDARPNAAHLALARLESTGRLSCVITQNIDGLHQAAGSKNVVELHGSNWRQYCTGCGAAFSLAYVMDKANCRDGVIPVCDKCGAIVRPDVVLYEEGLSEDVMDAAVRALARADLLIVGGTSLAVYPAAGLLRCFGGDDLVLINRTATPADDAAKLVLRGSIGQVLNEAVEQQ